MCVKFIKRFCKESDLKEHQKKNMSTNNVLNNFKKLTSDERAEIKEKFADVSIQKNNKLKAYLKKA